MSKRIESMLKEIQGEPVDNQMLDDALSQVASKLRLDPNTLGDVRRMATRVLSGESLNTVIEDGESRGNNELPTFVEANQTDAS